MAMKLTLFYTAPRPTAVWEGKRTIDSLSLTEQKYEEIEAKGKTSYTLEHWNPLSPEPL